MTFQLKRKRLDTTQAVADAAKDSKVAVDVEGSVAAQAATGEVADGEDEESKVRLSCDIARRNHKKLRVAAAERYVTIAQVVDDLIEHNLEP
jgi:hypothetical protein